MIEFETIEVCEGYEELRLRLDGIALPKASVTRHSDGSMEMFTHDQETGRLISQLTPRALPAPLDLSLPYRAKDGQLITSVSISTEQQKGKSSGSVPAYSFMFEAAPELARWSRPYSFEQYCDAFSRAVWSPNNSWQITFETGTDDKNDVSFFHIRFPHSILAEPICLEIARRSEILIALHKQVERTLLSTARATTLAVSFDFPERVRVPCEQYLLYFVEFLRDLGVEATSALTHDAGRVLFTVTPTDTHDALDRIRAALEIYLRLPSSPVVDAPDPMNEIAVQKLMANLHHLKGQLALSEAVLEAKNATIQAQQLIISRDASVGDPILDSVVDFKPDISKKENEELLGGIVAITKYKGKGFEVDVPELFRRLRQLFSKG